MHRWLPLCATPPCKYGHATPVLHVGPGPTRPYPDPTPSHFGGFNQGRLTAAPLSQRTRKRVLQKITLCVDQEKLGGYVVREHVLFVYTW